MAHQNQNHYQGQSLGKNQVQDNIIQKGQGHLQDHSVQEDLVDQSEEHQSRHQDQAQD